MDNLLHRLMLGSSTAALVAAISVSGAKAQDQSNNSQDIEQVVVSASRITIAGYTQPTPVTVVGTAQLEQSAYSDIIDSLATSVPQIESNPSSLSASQGGTTAGYAGGDIINLRALGFLRTLVLYDGQRFAEDGFSSNSSYDISSLPSAVISRVDVVTGGASAAWGSDAVAGVVNFVLNKNIYGFKATIQGSDTSNGLDRNLFASGTWGGDVFGGRGHVEVSATASLSPDFVLLSQENWYRGAFWVSNPAYAAGNGQPQLIVANNVGLANETMGGIINSSPSVTAANSPTGVATPANALRGIQFVGTGIPQLVNYGNVTSGTLSNGGSLTDTNSFAFNAPIASPRNIYTFFGYGRYKLTDTIQASVQLNASYNTGENVAGGGPQTALTIQSDNAFISASVRATMQANGITSFTLGTFTENNYNSNIATGANFSSQVEGAEGPNYEFSRHLFARGVFTLEGTIGDDWSWNAYAQSSETRYSATILADPVIANLQNAEDAVTVTTANRGTSGLPLGSIACRSTLTGTPFKATAFPNATAQPGCIPLDVFGTGVTSPAALGYISGATNGSYNHDNTKLEQDVMEASMQGTLPWELPAGKIAVAFGTGYRKEAGRQLSDPIDAAGGFVNSNFFTLADHSYTVLEGFAEVDAPILKNNIVNSLDFSMAGRMTSYSTSGLVETWKLGATSQVNDDVKLRTTWSVDIRAPNLYELYVPGSVVQTSLTDPKTNIPVVTIGETIGNPNLVPEVARTISGGVVLTPTFIPGLTLSADWYSINITGEIATIAVTAIVAQCNASVPSVLHPGSQGNPNDPLCTHLLFNGPNGALSGYTVSPINITSQTTSGLDLSANYTMDFWNGTLTWTSTDNYNDEDTINAPGALKNDLAGSDNFNGGTYAPGPKWKGVLSATYTAGPYSFTAQTRWFATAKLTNLANTGNLSSATLANLYDPAEFELPFTAYLDLRASYKWNDNIQLFGAIDNVTDVPPPLVVNTAANATQGAYIYGTNANDYGMLGRSFRVGVRFNY